MPLTDGEQVDMQKGDWRGYSKHREPCRQGTGRCAFGACRKPIEVDCVPAEMGMGMVRNKAGNIDGGRTMSGYRELRLNSLGTGSHWWLLCRGRRQKGGQNGYQ